MRSLTELKIKVLNMDIVTLTDGTTGEKVELLKIRGIIPLSEKKKEKLLCGEFDIFEMYDRVCNEYEALMAEAKLVDTITFTGYYDKYKFKPVTLVGYEKKKDK